MDLADASVGQVLIPVDDLVDAVEFYQDVLGLPFLFLAPPQMAFFQCGNVRLLLGVLPADQRPRRSSTIYFRVADIRAAHATLVERGVRFHSEPHRVHRSEQLEVWLAEFTDPDDNHMALMAEIAPPAAGAGA